MKITRIYSASLVKSQWKETHKTLDTIFLLSYSWNETKKMIALSAARCCLMVAHSLKRSVCVVYSISRLSNCIHFNHEKHTDKIKDEVEKNGSESSLWNYYFFSRLCICFSFRCTTPFHQFQQRNDCKEEPNCVYAIFRRETTDDGNRSLRLWQE